MASQNDSTDRTPADYVAIGLSFWGNIVATVGVIITSPATAIVGLVLLVFGTIGLVLGEKW